MFLTEVSELPEGLESEVGHADTAAVLGVPCNRVNVKLGKGDTVFVAQLQGGRIHFQIPESRDRRKR